nr:H430 [uncultured bacterium]
MRILIACAALLSVALPVAAQAQTEATAGAAVASGASELRVGTVLSTADGRRVGRVSRIYKSKDGTPVSASVIVDGRFAIIPISTITAKNKSVATTTLTLAEIRKLK